MTHPSDETLALLAHGRLEGFQLEDVESHLDGCAPCRSLFAAVTNGSTPHAQPERVALKTGERLGRYEIDALLAAGGMGMLYTARDTQLNRRAVLKLMRPRFADELGKVRLLREAQAMASLSHPNVVNVYELGESDGRVFMAMELVQGGTLRDWMKSPGSWKDVVAMMVQAGKGLAAAHANGVVHRDFKPENVLVGKDGRPRVGDFGLARPELVAEEEPPKNLPMKVTHTGTMLGTPAYMSPEQLAGKPADARSDQYSFCVTLYEALVGKRPFPADTLDELRARVAGGMPPPPKDGPVPAHVWAAIARGLHPSPERRFPDMDALLSVLELSVPAAAVSPGRWRRALGLAAAALLTVALGGGVLTAVLRPLPVAAANAVPDVIHLAAGQEAVFDVPGLRSVNASGVAIGRVETVKDQLKIVGGQAGQGTLQIALRDGRLLTSVVEVPGERAQSPQPAPAPAAASDAREALSLPVGMQRVLEVPGVQRLAVGDPSIADVKTIGSDQILLTGAAEGTTTLLVWKPDGTRRSWEITVARPAPPAASPDGALTIPVGMQMVLDVPGLQRIAVGDTDIADVKAIGSNQILVTGVGPGKTTLLVWKAGGARSSWTVAVTPARTEPKP